MEIGVCKRKKDGERDHKIIKKVDCYGNKYVVCDDCGMFPVDMSR